MQRNKTWGTRRQWRDTGHAVGSRKEGQVEERYWSARVQSQGFNRLVSCVGLAGCGQEAPARWTSRPTCAHRASALPEEEAATAAVILLAAVASQHHKCRR
ncbi:hypothetical protein HBI56_027020 [Parastagonospora nodorum]|uniref:Uncharacterized protein n=1 Tax=Phaeosphaeria nodorum (strain SN15 / ATCC MYA-4574 / FGSC 10173) TaxID=321614 RepID=A0A7U2F1F3_PHANO|nr:hypothetical protein HBH56_014670 [Parastagonospora nodorum]QRC94955.1 hypothetical protein JI435_406580 [Parastagonospora nodorum SN15]KAH3936782.1 hypothetical protein HBH54_019770 [Parastagonospora nodorum]KAH3953829.1 hypothetical protein HBH53_032170 [Parastagonospora nodorum]KAH3969218.1 hypothetical protein HBH51_124340 [Parastagonospora nodorum]